MAKFDMFVFMKRSLTIAAIAFLGLLSSQMSCISIPADECIEKPCNSGCSREMKPVCGCNDKTYHNPCLAECHGIMHYTEGPCPEERNALKKKEDKEG